MAFFEDLAVGQAAETAHTVTAADIEAFGQAVGDFNPVHFDEAYAHATPFGGRIAHGMMLGGYISALLASDLPGPGAIYLSQSLEFLRAVRIGDEVLTRVEITALDDAKGHATLATSCRVGRKAMVRGQAVVLVPRRPI
jgi:3-hydroxybutyryl-CoA dehydratase